MEELLDLHDAFTQHRYDDAPEIVEEMTATKKEIISKIGNYIRVSLIHSILLAIKPQPKPLVIDTHHESLRNQLMLKSLKHKY